MRFTPILGASLLAFGLLGAAQAAPLTQDAPFRTAQAASPGMSDKGMSDKGMSDKGMAKPAMKKKSMKKMSKKKMM